MTCSISRTYAVLGYWRGEGRWKNGETTGENHKSLLKTILN
jgi:hypothetical protein